MRKTALHVRKLAAVALVLCTASLGVLAQEGVLPPPQNVLQLSASGSVEVAQDLLTVTLTASEDGSSAAALQKRLQQVVDAALTAARAQAKPGAMEVHTGGFSVYPRPAGKDGKPGGWQGRAQLVLEGQDFERITRTAARVQGMPVSQVAFGLSKEGRAKVEGDAQHLAVEQFKAKAAGLAKAFGFANYSLREVTVHSNESGGRPYMSAGAMLKTAMAEGVVEDSALSVEAGKTQVQVQISGSVQLK